MSEDLVIDLEVDNEKAEEGLVNILEKVRPNWKRDDIQIKPLQQQGFINHMYLCKVNENQDDWLVARVFGMDMTVLSVERELESRSSRLLSELKIGPPVYATFKNGIVFGFVKGKTYFWTDLSAFKDVRLLKAMMRTLARLHSQSTKKIAIEKYGMKERDVTEAMGNMIKNFPEVIVNEKLTKWYHSQAPSPEEWKKEIDMIAAIFENAQPTCFCHNDANPTNLVYNEENDKVTLVDFELCGISRPFRDIGSFMHSSASGMATVPTVHSIELQNELYRTYLTEINREDNTGHKVTDEEVEKWREICEASAICGNYFFHIVSAQILNGPAATRHMEPKMMLGLSFARLAYYQKARPRLLEIVDKYKDNSTNVIIM